MNIDVVSVVGFFVPAIILVAAEANWPGPRLSGSRAQLWRHRLRSMLWMVVGFIIAAAIPWWVNGWLAHDALLDLSGWGWVGFVPALITYQFIGYFCHRALHTVPLLWRFHQLHHSSARIDVLSGFIFHPIDLIGWSLLGSISAIGLLGVSAEAAMFTTVTSHFLSLLGHTHVQTPRWLGILVCRPENHALHHQFGVHADNYANLPFIDMMFGTWRNPAEFPVRVGFAEGASERITEMLLGVDVSQSSFRTPPDLVSCTPEEGDEGTLHWIQAVEDWAILKR